MAHCVNRSSPEFIELAEQSNINPIILAAKVSLWQEKNGLDNFPMIEDIISIEGQESILLQTDEIPASTTSPELLKKVKEVVAKMGVKIETLADYVKGNPNVDTKGVNGLADLVKGVIALAENKEGVSLTEEMVHIATAMLEQTNPKLVTEMISKIGKFKIYNEVLKEYSKNPAYQTKDGKPDIRKIKKEAVDKLIVEVIIKQSEGSTEFPELLEEADRSLIANLWQKILNFIKQLYEDVSKKSNLDIFEEAASKIIAGGIGARYYNEVKPEVEELFESNPELAKAVYKVLGFDRLSVSDIGTIFKDPSKFSKEDFDALIDLGYTEDEILEKLSNKKSTTHLGVIISKEQQESALQYYSAYLDSISVNTQANIEGFKSFMKTAPVEFEGEDLFFQVSDIQQKIQERILNTQKTLEKREDVTKPIDPMFLDTEEASNYYVILNPDGTETTVTKRVTDRVKLWYKQRFGDKQFTKEEKEFNELKRTIGVEYHNLFELVHGRYFNNDGTRKTSVAPRHRMANSTEKEVYDKLEKYYVDLIASFSKSKKSPLVFSEVKMYDPKAKEAGTVDLLIVEEDGTTHIFDWKFMNISQFADDVPWFKQGAFNIQLGRYKEMLRDVYGVKKFGNMRAIPFLMEFKKIRNKLTITGIASGSVDVSKIQDLRLVPVSEETETTDNEELDELVVNLNTVYRQISKVSANTDEERESKRERLNTLKRAIRAAQSSGEVDPLVDVIKVLRQEGDKIVNDWKTIYEKKPASSDDINDAQLSEFSDNIREYIAIASVFKDVDKLLSALIYTPEMEIGKKTKAEKIELAERRMLSAEISAEAKAIYSSLSVIKKVGNSFADKFIGQRNLVSGLLKPQAIWQSLGSYFRGAADSPLKSIQILVKLVDNARGRASKDAIEEVEELMSIRERLVKRGGNLREIVKAIYQKDDKNNMVNKLIYKFKKEFYDGMTNNALEGNKSRKWLEDNVDMVAYKKESTEVMKKQIARIKSIYEDNIDLREDLINKEKDKWDVSRKSFNGWNNYILRRHPKELWLSEEYKQLAQDADLLALYNFITKINEKAADIGYIQNKVHSTFIPFVRKSLAESLAWDFSLSAITNLGDNLTLRADDVGYGSLNELTKEVEYAIPKYYTSDFTVQEDGKHDYSDVSEDIFKNMILYVNHTNNYKYLSNVEGQLKFIKTIETFKSHLVTSTFGNVIETPSGNLQEENNNTENTKIYDEFMRAILYEEKYPLSSGDTPLNISTRNAVKKAINKVAGKEVYTIDENPDAKSLIKTMDVVNKAFQLKTLGFEFVSGAVNWFGNNIQLATQSGNYFKSREIAHNESLLLGNKFKNDDERSMFAQLIDIFTPLKDDPLYEEMKKSGMSELTKHNYADMLMWFMRAPETHMEKTVFLTLLDNTMVEDGKLVNIREFVNSKYKDRYDSPSAYKDASKNIEKEIEELKKTRSISSIKTLVDGKLEIPGFDLSNFKEVNRLTTLTKRISRAATGGMTKTDMNKMSMNIWLKSMMVFKGWIPKLVDTRFGEFRKVSDDFSVQIDDDGNITGEKYDIGRIRLFSNFLHFNIFRTIGEINDILSVNENGLLKIDELFIKYAESYKKQTGEDLNMSRDEFADLIRINLRNQVKELAILVALTGIMFSMGHFEPDDDADKATKNFHRFTMKVIDKFVGELSFFYNPIELEKLLSGNAFPAIGLFGDITRFFTHLSLETTGYDLSNPDETSVQVRKKAQPVKYLGKMFPITKSMITYGAIFSDEFAKEFDVTVQSSNKR